MIYEKRYSCNNLHNYLNGGIRGTPCIMVITLACLWAIYISVDQITDPSIILFFIFLPQFRMLFPKSLCTKRLTPLITRCTHCELMCQCKTFTKLTVFHYSGCKLQHNSNELFVLVEMPSARLMNCARNGSPPPRRWVNKVTHDKVITSAYYYVTKESSETLNYPSKKIKSRKELH